MNKEKEKKPIYKKWWAWLIVLVIIAAVKSGGGGGSSPTARVALKDMAPNTSLSPKGELYEMFKMNSDNTDLQRDEKEDEIDGKVVQWTLPVYEVKKMTDTRFKIQTNAGGGDDRGYVGTFCTISTDDADVISKIKALKTGDKVTVKGEIDGVSFRNINLNPCLLILE